MTINQFVSTREEIEGVLTTPKQRSHFDSCSDDLILIFVSMAYNAAVGNLSLSKTEVARLAPYRKFILELGYCQSTVAKKRQLLNQNCKRSLQAIKVLHKIILDKINQKLLQ